MRGCVLLNRFGGTVLSVPSMYNKESTQHFVAQNGVCTNNSVCY